MPTVPPLAKMFGFIAFLLALTAAPAVSAATRSCDLQGGRTIGDGNSPVVIASHSAFDAYHYVMVEPVYINSAHVNKLSDYQRARLRTTFKQAIEQDWQERLGWRSSKRAGDSVLRLNIHINDIVVDSDNADTTMIFDVSLSDSLTGERLMAQCNETMNVGPQIAAVGSGDGIFWNRLQNSVRHWGAGLGSHIMTPY